MHASQCASVQSHHAGCVPCSTSAELSTQDLELVFYNSSAAESPITQGIKAFRGLTSKGK